MFRRAVRPLPNGAFHLDLTPEERTAVADLAASVRTLIQAEDEDVKRLFPDAYRDDPAASADYRSLVHDDLVQGRLDAIDTVTATREAERIDAEQLGAWCGALNDVRLVLGGRLGVTDDLYERGIDPGDPRAPQLALYGWLTWLQGEIVEALAAEL
jgi:Domain of unknown function (DUF2017)